MKYTIISLMPILLLGTFLACKPSTEPREWGGEYQLYQVDGCQTIDLGKSAVGEPCFNYQFDADLILDFCMSANCCPDSNRFALSQAIQDDSITITVQDTAANLCFCDCSYTIRAEFYDMPEDKYYVNVLTADGLLLYEEEVWRIF